MKTDLFDYELPEELIAYYPPEKRDGGRVLVLDRDTGEAFHHEVVELPELLPEGALLIANDTRVVKARLRAKRPTGGAVEVLLVRLLNSLDESCDWNVLSRANKPIRVGDEVHLHGASIKGEVISKGNSGGITLRFDVSSTRLLEYSEQFGEVPLPPYIKRTPEASDDARYQTVYAKHDGSVAAPTAGLHFTPELIDRLGARGIEMAHVTLHVGPGTFKPVTSENITDHEMETEVYVIDDSVSDKIVAAKSNRRPVIAVGTTATRALEGAFAAHGELRAGAGETNLFITPGSQFNVIDGLITNFHLPKSTLICLVSALAGRENVLCAYSEAVKERYRFYSYGDAMLIK